MAAAGERERERCPHCLRAFKRLRAHLPHCKAAPGTGSKPDPNPQPGPVTGTPGSGSGTGRALPAGKARRAAEPLGPGTGQKASGERGGGIRRQPGGHRTEPAVRDPVRDVAECLDLSPEEVTGIPEKLSSGAEIIIRKHRARVVREGSGSRGCGSATGRRSSPRGSLEPGGTDPVRAEPREGTLGPDTAKREAGGWGGKAAGMSPPPPRSSPRDGGDGALGVGGGGKPPRPALHPPKNPGAAEPAGGHPKGTPESEPGGTRKLGGGGKQAAGTPQGRRETGLALPPVLLQLSQSQSVCTAPARGLEWFPDLYPNYRGLRIFPGKRFQEEPRVTVKAPKGDFSEGQPGVLSAQHLLDVRLGELPAWLATRDLSPQGLLGGAQRAWSSFCSKYIEVKRGGPAGVSMLLAGYCLLSYCWNYQHTKHHRWRRYH